MEIANAETIQLCDKLSKITMEQHLVARTKIYIDADTLFDFKLGAVLSQVRGEAQFKSIFTHLDEYVRFPGLECARFFPEVGLTEEDIDKILKDPKLAAVVAVAAPPTDAFDQLPSLIGILRENNAVKVDAGTLTFTINQKLMKLHPYTVRKITEQILTYAPDANISFTSYATWNEVPQELLKAQDVIVVHDYRDFVKEGTSSQKLLESLTGLAKASVISLVQLDHPEVCEDDEKLKDVLQKTVGFMMLMCEQFTFIRKSVSRNCCLFKTQKGGKEE